MRTTIEMPTQLASLPEFVHALGSDREIVLRLPAQSQNRERLRVLAIVGNLLQHAEELDVLRLTMEGKTVARSLARAGVWDALHRTDARLELDPVLESTFMDWGLDFAPGQTSLLPTEVQWRPTTNADAGSRRLEHRVGFISRPDHRVAAFESADGFAEVIAEEIAAVAAGASRDRFDDGVEEFGRLMARSVSTWVENVGEHAFDMDVLQTEARHQALARRRAASLLVTLTRGGGTSDTAPRSSSNRVRLTVQDNGVSIPSTVRGHGRLNGLQDAEAIVAHLLSESLRDPQRDDLKGIGYPDLVALARTCAALGWDVSLQIITQAGDQPSDTVIASAALPLSGGGVPVRAEVVRGVPFVGTHATITISVPGAPNWLSGLGDE